MPEKASCEVLELRIKELEAVIELHDLSSKAPICFHSLNKEGIFVDINQNELNLLGYTREEVVDKLNVLNILSPESCDIFSYTFPKFKIEGFINNLELDFVKRNGQRLPVVINSIAHYDQMKCFTHSTSIVFDNTSIHKAEISLKESEEAFHQLFQNMISGFAVHEIITDDNGIPIDYRFLEVNPTFEKLTGLCRKEIIGKRILEVMPQLEYSWIERYGSVALTGVPAEFESYAAVLNKYYQVYAYQTKSGCFATIFLDITDRKLMEISLQKSEEKYRQLFEFLPVGITIADMNGNILVGNKEAENLLKLPVREHCKRTIDDPRWKMIRRNGSVMPPNEIPGIIALKQMRRIENVELGIIDENENVTWLNVTADPLPNNAGVIIAYLNINEEVERKKKLDEYYAQLKEADIMKDQFLSIIAHDLKNPFNSIMGFSDLLLNNINDYDQEKIHRFVSIIDQSAKHTLELLDNLLVWTRSQSGRIAFTPSTLNLVNIVRENVNLVISQASHKGIRIIVKPVPDVFIQADKNMLNTIIRNLLTNAIKFTLPNGMVVVGIHENESSIELSIKDSGVGIKPENLQKLFRIDNKFTHVGTANESGTGLGLILCKDFVERHRGSITVDSKFGEGSDFTVSFPK
jgi:PAS domain S-box-containing protein